MTTLGAIGLVAGCNGGEDVDEVCGGFLDVGVGSEAAKRTTLANLPATKLFWALLANDLEAPAILSLRISSPMSSPSADRCVVLRPFVLWIHTEPGQ